VRAVVDKSLRLADAQPVAPDSPRKALKHGDGISWLFQAQRVSEIERQLPGRDRSLEKSIKKKACGGKRR